MKSSQGIREVGLHAYASRQMARGLVVNGLRCRILLSHGQWRGLCRLLESLRHGDKVGCGCDNLQTSVL